jgi:hypothetical protein
VCGRAIGTSTFKNRALRVKTLCAQRFRISTPRLILAKRGAVRPAANHLEGVRLIIGEGVVRIAIQPTLAGLRRCNYRVPAPTCVLARVLLRRAVAAKGRAALLTCAQMEPSSADLHTLSALTALSMLDRCNRGKMGTASFRRHFTSLSKIHGRTEPTLNLRRRRRRRA